MLAALPAMSEIATTSDSDIATFANEFNFKNRSTVNVARLKKNLGGVTFHFGCAI